MSVQAMAWVIDHAPVSEGDFLCLLMIANHAKSDGTLSYPSLKTLALESRMTERNAIYVIQRLERLGLITVRRGIGRGHSNHYDVVMDSVRFPQIKGEIGKGEIIAPLLIKGEIGATKGEIGDIEKVKPASVEPSDTNHPKLKEYIYIGDLIAEELKLWEALRSEVCQQLPRSFVRLLSKAYGKQVGDGFFAVYGLSEQECAPMRLKIRLFEITASSMLKRSLRVRFVALPAPEYAKVT